jgi:heterodisulfide reductase subunit A
MKTENTKDGEKLTAEVIDAMCQGCGMCVPTCPTGAVKLRHYADEQVLAQIQTACLERETRGG